MCPEERVKFEGLGLAVLMTGGIAAVSMWFTLTSVQGSIHLSRWRLHWCGV